MAIFGDIIQEHFVREFRRNSKLRAQKLNCITTRDQAEQYIAELKEKVRKTFQFPNCSSCCGNAAVNSPCMKPDCFTAMNRGQDPHP